MLIINNSPPRIQGVATVAVTRNKQAHCHRTEKSTGNECKY